MKKRGMISAIRNALQDAGVPKDAAPMQAYMKSEMPFRGVKKPARMAALKPVFERYSITSWDDLRDTSLALWRTAKFREERYAVLDLTRRKEHRQHLNLAALPMFEELIVTGAWWDYVDELAVRRVGPILESAPTKMKREMRRWSKGDDMWKRRTSILCQLAFKGDTDRTLLEDCMAPSIDSKEFFLRKAIGWVLRDLSRFEPDWVIAYVEKHADRLSGLSKREAYKRMLKSGRVSELP